MKLSGLEIYNEQLEDLLVEAPGTPLKLVKHPRTGVVVQNLASILVNSADEIYQHLAVALEKRRTSATLCNKQSSRSHSVFTLTIHSRETTKDGEELLKVGKLNLVDLAGSECIGRSSAGETSRERGTSTSPFSPSGV